MITDEKFYRLRRLASALHPGCILKSNAAGEKTFVLSLVPMSGVRSTEAEGGTYTAFGNTSDEFADNMIAVLEAALKQRTVAALHG